MKSWLEAGLGLFYPEVCQICGLERATADEGYVGPACQRQVQWIQPPFCARCGLPFEGEITTPFECSNCRDMKLSFASARSAALAKGVTLDAIHRYKYQRALWFETFLADLLVRQAQPALSPNEWDFLVPIPLYPTKQREREFNQAERLARRLSAATRIPVNPRLVKRVKPTDTQTRLSRAERRTNMRAAFAPRRRAALNGERLVLVDDVLTTGATTSACAKTLLALGASSVCVWTVARGI